MKVLAVSASPRKDGNSDVLCTQFLKGAKEAGHETEKIRLQEKRIAPCLACEACQRSGNGCVIKDDMKEILDAVMEADVIVLATPVYFYSVSSQMKIFIDRWYAKFKEVHNKQFYFIVTAADPQRQTGEDVINEMRGLLRCLDRCEEKGVIYGTGAWDKGDILNHPAYQRAYEMGKAV